ncbi:MAG TPA: KH domain-containing protein [Eubacteriales bacterium]|nr:KH domain-containing protein [Clostridia bacterium]HRV72304.1 KH domain-containing protein [Eubacteriales bacterium]
MDKLVEYIAKGLVDSPELVKVNTREEEDCIVIELSVGPDDVGKVIGKQGRIAKAIRTIVKASSVNSDKKYMVEIL